jgi:hypothetical protein
MSSIGKFASSLLSATNENTLALLNVNLDFSLLKFDAPKEFTPLGQEITRARRIEAEDGTAHKTARRLGALFEQLIPSTPGLLKAYGLRASEIINSPGINPRGTKRDGPFEAFVGADCTAIWAAATSGPASLGVHLLSCMLARAWDAKESNSILVELIAERQKEINILVANNSIVSTSTLVAARQDISRSEIAEWDASVRSWLQRADEAKVVEHDQFLLIIKNVNIPFGSGETTYTKVVNAWTTAMRCLENLIDGQHQQVSNGGVLLALSAWHLFPNLVVFGSRATNVKFDDPLLPSQAVMTLGSEFSTDMKDGGTRWSLALSHLRYYGDPVRVESNENFSRVSMPQLHIVALGCILANWQVRSGDTVDAMRWIKAFWECLSRTQPSTLKAGLTYYLGWLSGIASAATHFLNSSGQEREICLMLMNFGKRRGQKFLGDAHWSRMNHPPYFGLCNSLVMSALSEDLDVDAGIRYLREAAQLMGLKNCDAVICYSQETKDGYYYEYATVAPHSRLSEKRLQDGTIKSQLIHGRWIQMVHKATKIEDEEIVRISASACNCQGDCLSTCPCKQSGVYCWRSCHDFEYSLTCKYCMVDLNARRDAILAKGEECQLLQYGVTHERRSLSNKIVIIPDKKYGVSEPVAVGEQRKPETLLQTMLTLPESLSWPDCPNILKQNSPCNLLKGKCQCFNPQPLLSGEASVQVKYKLGHHQESAGASFQLYIRVWDDLLPDRIDCKMGMEAAFRRLTKPSEGLDWLLTSKFNKTRLWDYIRLASRSQDIFLQLEEAVPTPSGLDWNFSHLRSTPMILSLQSLPDELRRSLKALGTASELYESLPGVTVSLKVIGKRLLDAFWIPSAFEANSSSDGSSASSSNQGPPSFQCDPKLSRTHAFACITYFESGSVNLHPHTLHSVLALCVDNSIFTSGLLLSDPWDLPRDNDIRHIIGNIGRAGITLLVAPKDPRIRSMGDDYRLVQHAPYDFKRENNFQGTSLHLSFTSWKLAIATEETGAIDHNVFLVESIISLWNCGKWIADLDPLKIENPYLHRAKFNCNCRKKAPSWHGDGMGEGGLGASEREIISLDSWEEFLDPPLSTGTLRAHGNWAARLGAVSILCQQGKADQVSIWGKDEPCWSCLEYESSIRPGKALREFIID